MTLEQLATLPLLDKQLAIPNQHELVVGERPAGFGIASSATTHTTDLPVLNVLRTPEEHAAIRGDGVNDKEHPRDGAPNRSWRCRVHQHAGEPLA